MRGGVTKDRADRESNRESVLGGRVQRRVLVVVVAFSSLGWQGQRGGGCAPTAAFVIDGRRLEERGDADARIDTDVDDDVSVVSESERAVILNSPDRDVFV